MRLLNVADVQHEVIDATRRYRLVYCSSPGLVPSFMMKTLLLQTVANAWPLRAGHPPRRVLLGLGWKRFRRGNDRFHLPPRGERRIGDGLQVDPRHGQAQKLQDAVGQLIVATEAAAQ